MVQLHVCFCFVAVTPPPPDDAGDGTVDKNNELTLFLWLIKIQTSDDKILKLVKF